MNIESLRKLIKEEVEAALLEHGATGMDHPRFRRAVSQKLGRELASDEGYHETWACWHDMMRESAGQQPDRDMVDYYVSEAARRVI